MAIHDNDSKVEVNVNEGVAAGATNQGQQAQANQANPFGTGGNIIGFGNRNIFKLNANGGSEYTKAFTTVMVNLFNTLPEGARPKINVLDKEQIQNLAYSSIVVSYKVGQKVIYYIVLLEATGRQPSKANEMIAEVNMVGKVPGQNIKPAIFTTDDAIDEILHQEIFKALSIDYGQVEFDSIDGVVVPHTNVKPEEVAPNVAALAHMAIATEVALRTGEKDLNITAAKKQNPALMLKFEPVITKSEVKDEVGKPIRADWQVSLVGVDGNTNLQSLNMQNNNIVLARTTGFIDALPVDIQVPTQYGMPPQILNRFRPHIIINNISTAEATVGYALLGVINGLVMTNKNLWIKALMPSGPKDHNNVGALNVIANLNEDKNGGQVLKLADKSVTFEKAVAIINQMFPAAPAVSLDIESFGPNTYQTSVFAIAAQAGNTKSKVAAANKIIESASWLTNGKFPSDFNVNEIFAMSGVLIPSGSWADTTGERDIKDIDLAFICNRTGDDDLIDKWIISNAPKETTNVDPYITRVGVTAALIPTAEISGKTIRVTFTDKFIRTLSEAAYAAGLNVKFDHEVIFNEGTNIGVVGNIFETAGLSNVTPFAQAGYAGVPSFTMGNSNLGFNRF